MRWWEYLDNPAMFRWDPVLGNNLNFVWLAVLGAGLYFANTPGRKDRRPLLAFLAYSVLMEYVTTNGNFQQLLGIRGNAPLYHALTPGLFFLLLRLFLPRFFPARWRALSWGGLLAFLAVTAVYALPDGRWREFPTVTATLYALTGIACCLGYFLRLLVLPPRQYLERVPLFWIAAAGLIYFSGSVLVLAAVNYLDYEPQFFNSVFGVYRVLTLVFLLAILVAFVLPPVRPRPVDESNAVFDFSGPT